MSCFCSGRSQLAITEEKKLNLLEDHKDELKLSFSIVLIGETCVGKTQILKRMANENFSEHSSATLGVDFIKVNYAIKNQNLILTFWDTAGQERFRSMTQSFFRHASGCILVFDLTSLESFEMNTLWIMRVQEYTKIPIILVGNKIDCCNREVSRKMVEGKKIYI